jgi:hypothetical protein
LPNPHGGLIVKIVYDNDIDVQIRPEIKSVIKKTVKKPCECECDEIYVSLQDNKRIDVKCYDCGRSYFEIEIEIDN